MDVAVAVVFEIGFSGQASPEDAVGLLDGAALPGRIPRLANTNWTVVGTGDYDASEEADILWRNEVTGANKTWLMQGLTRTEQSKIPKIGDTQWEVQR